MTEPLLCRDGHFYPHPANRFDNMSNTAYIVNRQFQYAAPDSRFKQTMSLRGMLRREDAARIATCISAPSSPTSVALVMALVATAFPKQRSGLRSFWVNDY
jgi:hypothetical protein